MILTDAYNSVAIDVEPAIVTYYEKKVDPDTGDCVYGDETLPPNYYVMGDIIFAKANGGGSEDPCGYHVYVDNTLGYNGMSALYFYRDAYFPPETQGNCITNFATDETDTTDSANYPFLVN